MITLTPAPRALLDAANWSLTGKSLQIVLTHKSLATSRGKFCEIYHSAIDHLSPERSDVEHQLWGSLLRVASDDYGAGTVIRGRWQNGSKSQGNEEGCNWSSQIKRSAGEPS